VVAKCGKTVPQVINKIIQDRDLRLSFVPMDLQNEGDDNVLDTEHICRFLEDGATLLVRLNKLDWEQLAKNITANASGGATRVVSQNTFSTADAMKPLEKEAVALQAITVYKEVEDKLQMSWSAAQAQLERAPAKAKEARTKMMAVLEAEPAKNRPLVVRQNWNKWRDLVKGDSACLKRFRPEFDRLLQAWVRLDRGLVKTIFHDVGLLPHVTLTITGGGSSLKCWTMQVPPLPPPLNLLTLVKAAARKFEALGPAQGSAEAKKILIPQRLEVLAEYTGCICKVSMGRYKRYAERTAIRTQIATGELRNGDSSDNREHMHRRKPPPSGFRRHKFARTDFRGVIPSAKQTDSE